MTKPQRRKSQLSGLSAVTPPATAAESPTQTPARGQTGGADTPKKKVAYYATDADNGRIRAAFLAGRNRYGWRSFTDFQLQTMLDRVKQLEDEMNDGKPFDGVPPKGGPLGRPLE